MKKFVKILTLVLCVVLCLSLFACAGKTTTDQDGNEIPETPGGTGDNNKPINLLDYFYEEFEDTVHNVTESQMSGNLTPLLDDIQFNAEKSRFKIKTKTQVFIETVTIDVAYNGKLTEAFYFTYTNYNFANNDVSKYLDIDCTMNTPFTYTFTLNKQFVPNTIFYFAFLGEIEITDENPMFTDNLRIKLKLK